MQAVLVGAMVETDWTIQGVPSKSRIETWPLSLPVLAENSDSSASLVPSLAGDGCYLYAHGSFGLLKIGTGYGRTIKVRWFLTICLLIRQCCRCCYRCVVHLH